MKAKLLTLLVICIITTTTNAQMWCPTGATWHYGYSVWMNAGYYKVSYVGDTLIDSIQCKIFEKKHVDNYLPTNSITTTISYEYTYADSNKVYVYRFNQFYTLYDFGANVGDTIIIAGSNMFSGYNCDSIGSVKVDSVGTTVINGLNLRYIVVSPLANSAWGWGEQNRIVEKIGPPNGYFIFPSLPHNCSTPTDILYEGGTFRCYSDSSFQYYPTGNSSSCDYLPIYSNLQEYLESTNQLSVYPNPALSELNFKLPPQAKDVTVNLKNMLGAIIYSEHLSATADRTIDISAIPNGVYIAQLQIGNLIFNKKFVKQ